MVALLIVAILFVLFLFFDLKKQTGLYWKILATLLLFIVCHCVGFSIYFKNSLSEHKMLSALLIVLVIYFLFRLSFYIAPKESGVSRITRIMMGGRRILLLGIFLFVLQIPVCVAIFINREYLNFSTAISILDIFITYLILFCFLGNKTITINLNKTIQICIEV